MGRFIDEVSDQLNLRWAWEKVRNEAQPGDIWFDEIELAGFELKLENNLESIAREIRKGKYRSSPLKPLPFPKNSDKDGNPQIRQAFQVAIRDQIAWMAIINVVGPHVDEKMPVWSYGNRLYRSIWIEKDNDGARHRRIGAYRHASGRLYMRFQLGWPIFRRHIYLTTRAMIDSSENLPEIDEQDKEEQDLQERLPADQRCPFLDSHYWSNRKSSGTVQKLFWCSVDLKKFYPSMKLDLVRENIVYSLPLDWRDEANHLLKLMLRFRLDLGGWSDDELRQMDLNPKQKHFSHLPTGLYVAGFLANAGLLKVDRLVQNHLTKNNVAHFRYVDDHIVLAYGFDELINWVDLYTNLLNEQNTGVKVNAEKVEPAALAELLKRRDSSKSTVNIKEAREKAVVDCCLDPQFPSPLMTKTITLVSGIARTDFSLLDSNELANLTDQLEHLLLVDLSEEEMPEKTRLSFAATRLTWIAERKLANHAELVSLQSQKDRISADLEDGKNHEAASQRQVADLRERLGVISKRIDQESTRLEGEINSAFQLIRKVLRERPDRVRLWTRAVLMCRLTGVKGLRTLWGDIERMKRDGNPLSAQYLMANVLALLGTQALIAGRTIQDQNVVHWRKEAARRFLDDICDNPLPKPSEEEHNDIVCYSWYLYNFGLYCASLVIQDKKISARLRSLTKQSTGEVLQHVVQTAGKHAASSWAWWAARKTLRDLSSHADGFVVSLGNQLNELPDDAAFWRFFPLDLPLDVAIRLADSNLMIPEGWWYDVINSLVKTLDDFADRKSRAIVPAKNLLKYHIEVASKISSKSLYDWCHFVRAHSENLAGDPRFGEWTALEIVRQIAGLVGKEPTFIDIISRPLSERSPLSLHPANFLISTDWITQDGTLTWEEWQDLVKSKPVKWVPEKYRIQDPRYTPVKLDNMLFSEVNAVRGLGLLLYGLLTRCFEFPTIWNGPGHSDLLGLLPKLLLGRLTCSSWTLGVLLGCLLPRATENLYLKQKPQISHDDDTLRDPVEFLYAQDVALALEVCQEKLKTFQLSTFGHKARQLTPISIKQLTRPDWTRDLQPDLGGGTQDV